MASRASDGAELHAGGAPPPGDEELLNEARSRAAARPASRDRWTTRGFVLAFAAAVGAMAAALSWEGSTSPLLIAGLVLAHSLLSRVEFEIGPGSAVPTQLALLPLGLLHLLLARERRARLDRAITFSQAHEVASHEARRDPLTGLGNRLAWENGLVTASGRPAGVVMLDVDGLKEANDTRGHAFGDELLRTVAAVVRGCVRDRDLLARIGGDEFALLMPDAQEATCREAEQRIAAALAAHPGLNGFPLTVSLGSATTPPAETIFDAHRLADRRMYAMKLRRETIRAPVLQ